MWIYRRVPVRTSIPEVPSGCPPMVVDSIMDLMVECYVGNIHDPGVRWRARYLFKSKLDELLEGGDVQDVDYYAQKEPPTYESISLNVLVTMDNVRYRARRVLRHVGI